MYHLLLISNNLVLTTGDEILKNSYESPSISHLIKINPKTKNGNFAVYFKLSTYTYTCYEVFSIIYNNYSVRMFYFKTNQVKHKFLKYELKLQI